MAYLVKVRIKLFTRRRNTLQSVARERIPKLAINQFEALAILLVRRIIVRLEAALKAIQRREQFLDQPADAASMLLLAVALDALAVVVEVRLTADHRLRQLFLFCLEARHLVGDGAGPFSRALGLLRIVLTARICRARHAFGSAVKFDHVFRFFFSVLAILSFWTLKSV